MISWNSFVLVLGYVFIVLLIYGSYCVVWDLVDDFKWRRRRRREETVRSLQHDVERIHADVEMLKAAIQRKK